MLSLLDFWVTPFDWWSGTPLAPFIVVGNFVFWPALFLKAWLSDWWKRRQRVRRKAREQV